MLPEKFLERMEHMLGPEYPRFLQSYDREEYHTLRVNPFKSSGKLLKQQMPFLSETVVWNKDGFYYDKDDRPGRHPYHDAGVYYIQEASAMAPVVYLEPQPGEKILDLCGAPGGKSTQIGAAMKNQGILICNEIHPARAKILSENVERMGLRNAIVTNETPQRLETAFPEYFDRILVDAPCSGEGMFRKNEEAREEWSPENVALCARRQDEILECAAEMLKEGGRLVYSTCTFAPAENEGTISRFLANHPEFEIEPVKKFPGMASGVEEWAEYPCEKAGQPGRDFQQSQRMTGAEKRENQGQQNRGLQHTIRLWPHKLKGEGHYVAVLRKRERPAEDFKTAAGTASGTVSGAASGAAAGTVSGAAAGKKQPRSLQKGLKEKDCKEYLEFLTENIKEIPVGILVKFGDQLYLSPEETPSLDGLRVLRPGLHLGTIKKNRFEPSHALALALPPENVKQVFPLSADSKETAEYLKGQTFPAEGGKGWYLITADGYGIGWGKLGGSVMKNHYPKGLRKM